MAKAHDEQACSLLSSPTGLSQPTHKNGKRLVMLVDPSSPISLGKQHFVCKRMPVLSKVL